MYGCLYFHGNPTCFTTRVVIGFLSSARTGGLPTGYPFLFEHVSESLFSLVTFFYMHMFCDHYFHWLPFSTCTYLAIIISIGYLFLHAHVLQPLFPLVTLFHMHMFCNHYFHWLPISVCMHMCDIRYNQRVTCLYTCIYLDYHID